MGSLKKGQPIWSSRLSSYSEERNYIDLPGVPRKKKLIWRKKWFLKEKIWVPEKNQPIRFSRLVSYSDIYAVIREAFISKFYASHF